MKRFVLCLSLVACGGARHAGDDGEPLTAEQQQCVDQHQRNNALASMREPDRAKLSAEADQTLLLWVHDLSYYQCTNDQPAADKVLRRRTSVSLVMTGTDLPPSFLLDRAHARANGVVETSSIPALAARPDVVQLGVEPTMERN
ncbi:hypothetical protein BH11MYX2_BH11MYX2_13900 [soil metagenome]